MTHPLQNKLYYIQTFTEDECSLWMAAISIVLNKYIGEPEQMEHTTHVTYDENGFVGIPAEWEQMFIALGITKEDFSLFNFVVVSTTHLHMYPFISIEKTAENLVNRYNALINMNLPFSKIGIAHPTCLLIAPNGQTKDVLNLIPEQTFKNIFYKLAEKKAGIELNKTDFDLNKVTIDDIKASLRVLNIAKNCGCKFYLGSDAHHPADFLNTRDIFSNLIKQLNLTENHKFTPKI
jgi:histidinol phosphatase-like PHP family hydrolase